MVLRCECKFFIFAPMGVSSPFQSMEMKREVNYMTPKYERQPEDSKPSDEELPCGKCMMLRNSSGRCGCPEPEEKESDDSSSDHNYMDTGDGGN